MVKKTKKKEKVTSKFNISKKDIIMAKKKTKAAIENARGRLLKAEKDIKNYVNKNPKKAAAIAAGIGAAVGAIVVSAMKKKK